MNISARAHTEWCKQRALLELETGGCKHAYASMLSDMNKHDETKISYGLVMMLGQQYALTENVESMRSWINGF